MLTIGRREDGTTFDPIKTAQNVDFWVFSNVYDVLVRVDKTGTKLEPGLAESWTVSDDALTYTFTMRDAKFSDGSPITAGTPPSPCSASATTRARCGAIPTRSSRTPRPRTTRLWSSRSTSPSAPFLSTLAMPGVSILSRKGRASVGEEAYAEKPVSSGAFTVKEWRRGERVILEKNPNFWEADRVKLDGVEWISVPDDNTRMLKVQAGELDCGDLRAVLAHRRAEAGSATSTSTSIPRPARITC